MLKTWLIYHLMCDIYVGLPKGQFLYVITLDQHVIHRRTRVINVSKLSRSLEPTTYHSLPGGSQMDSQSKLTGLVQWSSHSTNDQGDMGSNPAQGTELQFSPEVVQC